MSEETIALAIGSLFLLIAIVGGGFTIERAQIPQVPTWARIVSSIIGVAFIGFFGYASLGEEDGVTVVGRTTDGVVQQPPTVDAPPPGDGVHQDVGPHPSPAGLELSDLVASWDDPLRVNDTVAVRYRLTNASDGPIELDYTFVGVRSRPAGHPATGCAVGRPDHAPRRPGRHLDHLAVLRRRRRWRVSRRVALLRARGDRGVRR